MGHGTKKVTTRKLKQEASEERPSVDDEKLAKKVAEWVISINNELAKDGPPNSCTKICSLFRVPAKIRKLNKRVYSPELISIGPFHANACELKDMDEHKRRYLWYILNARHKQESARNTEQAESSNQGRISMEILVKAMKKLEQKTRNCYSEKFDKITSRKFVKMMLLDGCFVIQLMRFYYAGTHHQSQSSTKERDSSLTNMNVSNSFQKDISKLKTLEEPPDDPIFTTRWMLPVLQRDLFLLENQLPLFVLDELFELTKIDDKEPSLVELTLEFFDPLLPREKQNLESKSSEGNDHDKGNLESESTTTKGNDQDKGNFDSKRETTEGNDHDKGNPESESKTNEEKYDHLLAVFCSSFTSSLEKKTSQNNNKVEQTRFVLSVTELEEAGVKFRTPQKAEEEAVEKAKKMKKGKKVNKTEGIDKATKTDHHRDLIDIQFKENGVLEMPALMVDDYTKPLFLNLIAYEQCCPNTRPFFTDYILFLDSIVNSPQDVEILHYEGIIDHVLGSDEEVAKLFNELSAGVVYELEDCYLSEQLNKIRGFTQRRWRKWRKKLIQKKKNSLRGYFKNPWTIVSLIAGTFLIILTLIQTFTPFLPYLRPPKESYRL